MSTHAIGFLLPIPAADFAEAGRQVCAGNLRANPLELALYRNASLALISHPPAQLEVRDSLFGSIAAHGDLRRRWAETPSSPISPPPGNAPDGGQD